MIVTHRRQKPLVKKNCESFASLVKRVLYVRNNEELNSNPLFSRKILWRESRILGDGNFWVLLRMKEELPVDQKTSLD